MKLKKWDFKLVQVGKAKRKLIAVDPKIKGSEICVLIVFNNGHCNAAPAAKELLEMGGYDLMGYKFTELGEIIVK